MYINKAQYSVKKIICYICVHFFGTLGVIIITGMFMDLNTGESTPEAVNVMGALIIFFWIWSLVTNYFLKKVKIYDSFFATDADGIVYPKIVAKSLGITEKRVVWEMQVLLRKSYFKNCQLEQAEGENRIILSNKDVRKANGMRYKTVICRNCGGENRVREGFVYGCQYCSGRIE